MILEAPPRIRHVLLGDGDLTLDTEPALLPLLERWLPLLPYAGRRATPGGARLSLRAGHAAPVRPSGPASLQLGSVHAWVRGDRVALRGRGDAWGQVHLGARAARLSARPGGDAEATGWDVYSMATLALALLLGRGGRALVHAAAPVAPDGRAWLLVGDTHAGKSTTCANLLAAGWRFTSDDHVVLGRADDGTLWVEGLPRPFHLDDGWGSAAPRGRRGTTDPLAAWPGRWVERAPLGGVLLPQVAPERPTARRPVPAAEALAALIRQSPWLMADRAAAPALLALLGDAALLPAHRLRLGLDTFADPARLAALLQLPG